MEDISDFVAEFFEPERPPRDSSGRPMLVPRGVEFTGIVPDDDPRRKPYTRASGLGDLLEEFSERFEAAKGSPATVADTARFPGESR